METRYLKNEEYELWNKFVDSSTQGFIFDYSWWVDILTNGDFRICCVIDDDSLIVAGIVLPFFSTGNIHNTKLTQSQGILFEDMSKRNNMRLQKQITKQKEYTNLLWDYVIRDISRFKISFNYHFDYWTPLYWKGCKQTTKYTYLIHYKDYIPKEEFKRFSKGHKWILNKVEKKSQLKIFESNDIDDYLKEARKTYERQGLLPPNMDDVEKKLFSELKSRGMVKIFKIEDSDGCVHAVTVFVYNEKEAYYWVGASDANLRESGGHTYLVWHAIQFFADKVKIFNFGGSMIESVEKNFKNFSALPTPYYLISFDKHPIRAAIKHLISTLLKRNN